MLPGFTKRRKSQRGFSLLEMMFATIILLVGLVAVAQLVPTSILHNFRNRNDSAATVFAQRELDQMLDQPLTSNSFTDAEGKVCYLGDSSAPTPSNPNKYFGNSTLVVNNRAFIDFGASPISNYSFTYTDSTDPSGTVFDVRWAVILTGDGTHVFNKRFILGVRQQGGNGYFQPITLDTIKGKE